MAHVVQENKAFPGSRCQSHHNHLSLRIRVKSLLSRCRTRRLSHFFFPTGYIFAANGILSDNKLDQWSLTDQIEMGLSPTFASPGQRKTPSKVYSLAKTLVSSVPMHNDDHYTKLEELCSNSKRQAPLARSSGP